MNLQGRNLSLRMRGDDVQLLQRELQKLGFVIPAEETQAKFFGRDTRKAVLEFQNRHGLQSTGVVDDTTAKEINRAVDRLPLPEPFVVQGLVHKQDGSAAPRLIVKAFDKDLRREELLGEAVTDQQSSYEIKYTPEQFARAEKQHADLIVRAFSPNEGLQLATSDILFNAPEQVTVNLIVQEPAELSSEYERFLLQLLPILQDVPLADLTEEDVSFLVGETGLDRQHIEFLSRGAQLSRQTNLPTEVFYGFARQNLPLDLEALLEHTPEILTKALKTAANEDKKIIPARVLDLLDSIMRRLEQLRLQEGLWTSHDLVGQLLSQEIGKPLVGFTVRGVDLDASNNSSSNRTEKELGYDVTDRKGLFTLQYIVPRYAATSEEEEEESEAERRFRLHIINPQGEEIHQVEIHIKTDQGKEEEKGIEIRVPVPTEPEPHSPTLSELADTLELDLPEGLLSKLVERGVRTLADIRKAGGISNIEGLPVGPDHPIVRTIDAHASLSTFSPDIQFNAKLIEGGYMSPLSIASVPRTDFVGIAHEELGDFKAAQMQAKAHAHTHFLNNIISGLRVDLANGFPNPIAGSASSESDSGFSDLSPTACNCKDCEAAISPLAYLADLLDYTLTYLKVASDEGGDSETLVTLNELSERFHQLFGDLPAYCKELEENRVRQIRICIEVLWQYLDSKGLPSGGTPEAAEFSRLYRNYLVDTYIMLLNRIGTSYDELRRARTAEVAEREILANRLGITISLGSGSENRPDLLDALLLHPPEEEITEQRLEQLFGLVDTTRDPMSEGAKLRDSQGQIVRWNLDRIAWNRNTDLNGTTYVRLSRPADDVFRIELFMDQGRTDLVAAGERATAEGPVALLPENNSDLSGNFHLNYVADTDTDDTIEIVAIPHLLSWRLHYLRALWYRQDWPQEEPPNALPLIDPDLIGPGDLRDPIAGNPAYDLWEERRSDFVGSNLVALRQAREAQSTELGGLNTILENTRAGLASELVTLAERRSQGENLSEELEQLHLTNEAFNYLLRIRELAQEEQEETPILNDEWESVYSILVQIQKQDSFASWREEEKNRGVTLSPDYFTISELSSPPEPLPLPAWRATEAARRNWLNILQSRIDQEQGLLDTWQESILGATEEGTLQVLRDALVMATDAASDGDDGDDQHLPTKAKWITDHLLIDARVGSCNVTTRVAQAIETIQILLWSVRTRQLDSHPDLELDDDYDDFDEQWKWIGSYATWKAAMMVHLYPENILLPSLRRHQTPAFCQLVRDLRANSRLTPAQACDVARRYSEYFEDICRLSVEATCYARSQVYLQEGSCDQVTRQSCNEPVIAEDRDLFFMFGLGGRTKSVYWSYYDSQEEEGGGYESGYSHTFWRVVPSLQKVQIIGAAPYRLPSGQRFIYLFGLRWQVGRQELIFTRYDLEARRWVDPEAVVLEPPEGIGNFNVLLHQRLDEGRPRLTFQSQSLGAAYTRQLDVDGIRWEDDKPFQKVLADSAEIVTSPFTSYNDRVFIQALHHLSQNLFFVIAQHESGRLYCTICEYRSSNLGWPGFEPVLLPPAWHQTTSYWLEIGGLPLEAKQFVGSLRWRNSNQFYIFWEASGETFYQIINLANNTLPSTTGDVSSLNKFFSINRLLSQSGRPPPSDSRTIAYYRRIGPDDDISIFDNVTYALRQRGSRRVIFRSNLTRDSEGLLRSSEGILVRPDLAGPFDVSAGQTSTELQTRKNIITQAFVNNEASPSSNITYLQEAYYFVPIQLALQLKQRGQYTTALDWFRTIYDYSAEKGENRKIYYGLVQEENLDLLYSRAEDWLLDPLNPHCIASTRRNAYTRFTLISLVQCILDFADAEFTRDTVESVARARTLYMTALELLGSVELKQQALDRCDELVIDLDADMNSHFEEDGASEWEPTWHNNVLFAVREINDLNVLRATVNEVRNVMAANNEPLSVRLAKARDIVIRARATQPPAPNMAEVIEKKDRTIAKIHSMLLRNELISAAAGNVATAAGKDYLNAVSAVSGIAATTLEEEKVELSWLRRPMTTLASRDGMTPLAVSSDDDIAQPLTPLNRGAFNVAKVAPLHAVKSIKKYMNYYEPAAAYHFCVPPNPLIRSLWLHAESNLHKIRTCRNIAGIERQLEPYANVTDVESGLIMGGLPVLPRLTSFQPTQYRYSVLIERAKQLVNIAQQIEAAFLSTLEKRDAEFYNLLRARQEVQLARAGVRLQDLRLREAQSGVRLAELQREGAQIEVDHYQGLLNGYGGFLEGLGLKGINVWEAASLYYTGATAIVSAGLANPLQFGQSMSSFFGQIGNYERRREDWEFRLNVARQNERIGEQQIRIAQDRVQVVGQERTIAAMQAGHAETSADFLANKFTNVELYDWMSGILEEVYSFFLQQATSMARLAESQLAFERQEIPPPFIQADYWESPLGMGLLSISDGAAADRRGLTGSARLLQDIFQLDQYSFQTDRRKLQLTKTISLAQLAPAEFQLFRETGIMRFNTPTEMFDRDFPGHYLRLIKRVRTSVIALIPPVEGIKATLATVGLSRVTIGSNGRFQEAIVRRPLESIALSSPRDATGLFELVPQSQQEMMLLPFEGIGLDTAWEFQLPKASNSFNYNTIADVLITIEYTALNSFEYRQQVIQQLNNQTISADRAFSFRREFADQWYDLNHPELVDSSAGEPMVVEFTTRREDFPPNIEDLRIQHVVLYFARKDGMTFEVPANLSLRAEEDDTDSSGGSTTSIDGIISTRQGNAAAWMDMINRSTVGVWELNLAGNLSDGRPVREAIKNEEIEDILFVITYRGRTPAWPS